MLFRQLSSGPHVITSFLKLVLKVYFLGVKHHHHFTIGSVFFSCVLQRAASASVSISCGGELLLEQSITGLLFSKLLLEGDVALHEDPNISTSLSQPLPQWSPPAYWPKSPASVPSPPTCRQCPQTPSAYLRKWRREWQLHVQPPTPSLPIMIAGTTWEEEGHSALGYALSI